MSTSLLLVQLLNGLQYGVLLFLLAAGLTLVFGIMSFVNLAHGSLYMVGAYAAALAYGASGSFVLALFAAIATALVVGCLLEVTVVSRLYRRDHLDHVLATFGLVMFFNEGVRLCWGPQPLFVQVPEMLSGTVTLLGLNYPSYRFAIIVVGLLVAVGSYWLIHRTRVGMLIRAGAQNPQLVGALGVNIGLLNALLFGVGAMLAGLAGAMAAPLLSVQSGMGEPVLITTLVVIVIGGIGSVSGALYAALIVGVVDTLGRVMLPLLLRQVAERSIADAAGPALASMLVYVLMAVVLALRPKGLFPGPARLMRTMAGSFRRRAVVVPLLLFAGFAAVPFVATAVDQPFWISFFARILIYAIAASALNLALGYGGLVSFGHALFMGLGSYAVALPAFHGIDSGWLHLAICIGGAALVAWVVGTISLRTSGMAFIMITLAFAQMGYFLLVSLKQYGGDDGLPVASTSRFGGLDLGATVPLYATALVVLALLTWAMAKLRAAPFGMALRGARQNARRIDAIGLEARRLKLVAFVLSGTICALSGLLLANLNAFASPSSLAWTVSGELIVMVVLGGIGTVIGPVIGALVFLGLEELLKGLTEHWMVIFGPLIVVMALTGRRGVVGLLDLWPRASAPGPASSKDR